MPAITSADDGKYVMFRKTGGGANASVTSTQQIIFSSLTTNIVGIDVPIQAASSSYGWIGAGTQTALMRKFQIATVNSTSYWFVSNDA